MRSFLFGNLDYLKHVMGARPWICCFILAHLVPASVGQSWRGVTGASEVIFRDHPAVKHSGVINLMLRLSLPRLCIYAHLC
jgi:hypothetical protein